MTALATYALTTVADVKESLGIASSVATYNNLITRKINQATDMIESYCGRRFAATTYTDEIYNGSSTDQLVLRQRPIIGDVVFKVRSTALNQDNFETVESSLIFADAASGVLDLMFRSAGRWGRYTVTYRAGYEAGTLPSALQEACASLAAYLVTNADASNIATSSKQEGQRKIDYSRLGLSGTIDLFMKLGIDDVLAAYANTPVFADK